MDGVWQEHRRFIISLVVGALVFLIVWLVIDGLYGSDIRSYRTRIQRHRRAQRQALPPGVRLSDVRRERQADEDAFQEMLAVVQRVPDEGFSLAGVTQNVDLHYTKQIDRVRKEVLELCALENVAVDQNLGLPSRFPASRTEKEWFLNGLDVVRQVLLLALEANGAMEGGITRIENISIKTRKVSRGNARRRDSFLKLLPVSVSIVGHPLAVNRILADLPAPPGSRSKPGRYLALLDGSMTSLDSPPGARRGKRRKTFTDPADSNRVRLDLTVAAVSVDPSGRAEGAW